MLKLTLEEKCALVTGQGMWHTKDLEGRVPAVHLADGPHGLRAQEDGKKNDDSLEATCFPTASAAACSWDEELIEEIAGAISEEAKEAGVGVVLGPGVNMKRSPLCGRNFEYYSEDPLLSGKMAAAFIRGLQKNGTGSCLKHFAGNNQETHRMLQNSAIDRRALREYYLPAFEIAVKEAKPAAVMAAYNRLNGKHCCENRELLTDILRKEWGFDGLIVSDWGACSDLPASVEAGMDLEMPESRRHHYEALLGAARDKKVSEESLDRAVGLIMQLADKYASNTSKTAENSENTSETVPGNSSSADQRQKRRAVRKRHHLLAVKAAEKCAVLIKNDRGFLPLPKDSEVLVIGGLALGERFQGGGSSHINTRHVSAIRDSLKRCGLKPVFAKGYDPLKNNPSTELEEEAMQAVCRAVTEGRPILFFGGLTDRAEGEGYDRLSYNLPYNQESLLKKILSVTDNVGYVSFGGAPYDLSLPLQTRAVLQMYLGGEGVGMACARLLCGKAVPCGKLAETFPVKKSDFPCRNHFGEDMLQLPRINDVQYRESMFAGYRYYDTYGVPVQVPFGHGLSYTDFFYDDLNVEIREKDESRAAEKTQQENTGDVSGKSTSVLVSFRVKNTGSVKGSEISQIYVRSPETSFLRPARVLAGFGKVTLEPGEEKRITAELWDRAFQVYADHTLKTEGTASGFVSVKGTYEIQVGASIEDIRLTQKIPVRGENVQGKYPESLKESLNILSDHRRLPHIPLRREMFEYIYGSDMKEFTAVRRGDYNLKNSIRQIADTSLAGRMFYRAVTAISDIYMFPKSRDDPESRMMRSMIMDGNLDSLINQSKGFIRPEMVSRLLKKANKMTDAKKRKHLFHRK